jgi:hypothetical protein
MFRRKTDPTPAPAEATHTTVQEDAMSTENRQAASLVTLTELHLELEAEGIAPRAGRRALADELAEHLTADVVGRAAVTVEVGADVLARYRAAADAARVEAAEKGRQVAAEAAARREAARNAPRALRSRLQALADREASIELEVSFSREYVARGGSDYDPDAARKVESERQFLATAPAELASIRSEIADVRRRLAEAGASEAEPLRPVDALAARGAGWDR